MALLLSLESSTHSFSCALHQDQKLIAFEQSKEPQTTASMLAVSIEKLFENNGQEKNKLSAVVVAAGPGSYTGLRIGVATAKGICFALGIPLIAVNTLSLITRHFLDQHPLPLKDSLLCSMLDARRMEVYCMLTDQDGVLIEPVQAKIIDEKSYSDYLTSKIIYFFGEGSGKCKNLIRHPNAKFIEGIKPSAAYLGAMGFQKYLNGEMESPELFVPLYLKDFAIKKPKLLS